LRLVIGAAVILGVGGCGVFGGIRNEPLHAGHARTFRAHLQEVIDATLETVRSTELQTVDDYEPSGGTWVLIRAKPDSSARSGRTWIRIAAVTTGDYETTVRVLVRSGSGTDRTARTDFSATIFNSIERRLRELHRRCCGADRSRGRALPG